MTWGSCSAESTLVDVNRGGLKAPPTKGQDEWLVSPPRTNSAKITDAGVPRSASMPLLDRSLANLQGESMYLMGGAARMLIQVITNMSSLSFDIFSTRRSKISAPQFCSHLGLRTFTKH